MRTLSLLTVVACVLAGCGEQARHGPGDEPHAQNHPVEGEQTASHAHVAPHGGQLVELAHERLQLELLHDPTTGKLTAWVLDGCCEKPVRLTQEELELTLRVGGTASTLRLAAVENPLTGERKGETSQFEGQSDSLRGARGFSGVVRSVRLGTQAFQDVAFDYAGTTR